MRNTGRYRRRTIGDPYNTETEDPMNNWLTRILPGLTALALLTLAPAHHAAAQQAFPPPATPVPEPKNDAFYTPPSTTDLRAVVPGTVLRYREINAKAYYLFPIKGQAWQLMYRSTDHKGQPVAMVGTVLVPVNAPAQDRQLMAYNIAYDALTLRCAPSYEFVKGTALEQALIQSALKKGLVVMSPDYEGLQSLWTVGLNSGHGVLDGIRAAEHFTPAGLSAPRARHRSQQLGLQLALRQRDQRNHPFRGRCLDPGDRGGSRRQQPGHPLRHLGSGDDQQLFQRHELPHRGVPVQRRHCLDGCHDQRELCDARNGGQRYDHRFR